MNYKTCIGCGETKSLDCFGNNKNETDGKRSECKKCYNAKHLEWYHKHKHDKNFKQRERKSIEKQKPRRNKQETERRATDEKYSMFYNMYRRNVWEINKQGAERLFNMEGMLGNDKETVYQLLKVQGYEKGKTWMDHIIPLSVFDLKIKEHQIVGFNYLNLQPLTRRQNIRKRGHLIKDWEEILNLICNKVGVSSADIVSHIKSLDKKTVKESFIFA